MEYCEKGNMKEYMQENEMSFEKCTSYFMNIVDAVRYLHCDKHICHRDIKPDNILATNNGQKVKLADFGLARIFAGSSSDATLTGGVGTYGWLAPEMLKDDEGNSSYSFPADIFALGLLFLAVLMALPEKTSIHPFASICLRLPRHSFAGSNISL